MKEYLSDLQLHYQDDDKIFGIGYLAGAIVAFALGYYITVAMLAGLLTGLGFWLFGLIGVNIRKTFL